MPGGDRTGPMSAGPRTGRGLGICAGNEGPGYATSRPIGRLGRGFRGRGRGFGGRGWRNRYYGTGRFRWERGAYSEPTESQEQEFDSLKSKAKELQEALQQIQSRLDEIES